jgi:hypothetical protein
VQQIAPQLLDEPGFGPLVAAKLVGEIAGAQRFATAAKLARAAGVAPIPASSGNTQRHRLDQGDNRQINAALHRIIVTRARCHQPTRDYIERRRHEGKSTREAIRCLKRYLARRVWHLLQAAPRHDCWSFIATARHSSTRLAADWSIRRNGRAGVGLVGLRDGTQLEASQCGVDGLSRSSVAPAACASCQDCAPFSIGGRARDRSRFPQAAGDDRVVPLDLGGFRQRR